MSWNQSSGTVISQAADTGLRRLRVTPRAGLSDSGIAFLKCAFAPPDFANVSNVGVPDDFRGTSLVKKHRLVSPLSLVSTNDYYIILAPVPGVAYFQHTTAAGVAVASNATITGVNYSDFTTLFPTVQTLASVVPKYRFVSNHIEIIPTINEMTWSGSIFAWKVPLAVFIRESADTTTSDLFSVSGLNGMNSTLQNMYTGPFIKGVYTACYSSNCVFNFKDTIQNVLNVPSTIQPALGDFGALNTTAGFPGLDDGFEAIVIKISGMTANQTCLIKTWACVEYQVSPNNGLYQFSTLSPCDKAAIELYREIINGLPVGVPFEMNESFWTRVLQIIHSLTGVGSLLPGPYGTLSRGANLLSGGALQLLR
jgi:hypothetical protein